MIRQKRDYIVKTHEHHDIMNKQTTVRLPDGLVQEAESVARVQGSSVIQPITDSLRAEIGRVRAGDFLTIRVCSLNPAYSYPN